MCHFRLSDGSDKDSVSTSITVGVVGGGFEGIACCSSGGYAPRAPKWGSGVDALEDIVPPEFYFGHRDIIGGGSAHRKSRIAVLDALSCPEIGRQPRRNLIVSRE